MNEETVEDLCKTAKIAGLQRNDCENLRKVMECAREHGKDCAIGRNYAVQQITESVRSIGVSAKYTLEQINVQTTDLIKEFDQSTEYQKRNWCPWGNRPPLRPR